MIRTVSGGETATAEDAGESASLRVTDSHGSIAFRGIYIDWLNSEGLKRRNRH
ncbi:hypothetical protein N9260_00710 [bacterium]|nr:hypothetical protein [bacterium]